MHEAVVESLAMAFRGQVDASRAALERSGGSDPLAQALWSFAAADYATFALQVAAAEPERTPDRAALRSAVRLLLHVECEGRVVVPVDDTLADAGSPVAGLIGYLMTETAYSVGLLERGASISRMVLARSATTDPFVPWVRISRIRILVFLGLLDDAEAEIERLRAEVVDWPIGAAVLASHEALIAGVRGDAAAVEAAADAVRKQIPRPAHQIDAMTVALTGLALSTVARPDLALEVIHVVGDDLELIPVVSRCHVGDLAVESCLLLGLEEQARWFLHRSEALDVEPGSFCEAAVQRSRARVRAHEADDVPDAGPHAQMYLTKQRALADVAALPTSPADIAELTRLIAGEGLVAVLVWAGQEPGSEESALRLFAGLGWDSLSPQARVVARLAAAGLRNREIAETMFLAEKTVESHVAAVLGVLGARTRVGIGARTSFADSARRFPGLTPRQVEIADLVAEGLANHEIGVRLSISSKTVEKHLTAIFGAMGVGSRAAVAAAVRAR